jgi:tetratricopeptide (TPR) repeat protein
MKQLFSFLFACFFTLKAFSNNNEDIQQLVLEAEKQWNAGNPDKSFLSAGNSIEYGLGYLKKNKFTESLWYFEEAIKKDGNNDFAQLFAGLASTGLGQFAAAEANFLKLNGVGASLQQQAKALLVKARQEATEKAAIKTPETIKAPARPQNAGGTKTVATQPTNEPGNADENKKGGSLVYGDYVFTLDYWDVSQRRMVHQQKGFFTLLANGTYRYMGSTGKYSYNHTTGVITWQSGTFKNMGKNATTFQRNKKTCEIDFVYQTSGGKVYYSGGRNL